MNRYASRKFLLSLLTISAATGLLVAGLLDSGQWVTTVGGTLALYMAGNVSQKVWSDAP